MKIIKVPRGIIIEAFDNQPATYDANITYDKVIIPFLENKIRILDAAFMIENHIETIISFYFFGRNNPETKEQSEKFRTFILTSDWCTFSSKRKLINQIINEKSWLKGSEKNDYDKLLQKSMSHRNAFTHGTMSTNGDVVKLRYYEGTPKIKKIDDDFLAEIEKDLNQAFNLTYKIELESGAVFTEDLEK